MGLEQFPAVTAGLTRRPEEFGLNLQLAISTKYGIKKTTSKKEEEAHRGGSF